MVGTWLVAVAAQTVHSPAFPPIVADRNEFRSRLMSLGGHSSDIRSN